MKNIKMLYIGHSYSSHLDEYEVNKVTECEGKFKGYYYLTLTKLNCYSKSTIKLRFKKDKDIEGCYISNSSEKWFSNRKRALNYTIHEVKKARTIAEQSISLYREFNLKLIRDLIICKYAK